MAGLIKALSMLLLISYAASLPVIPDSGAAANHIRWTPRRLCGSKLTDAIMMVCQDKIHHPSIYEEGRNEVKREVVDECCLNPCTFAQISRYCEEETVLSPIVVTEFNSTSTTSTTSTTTTTPTKKNQEISLNSNKVRGIAKGRGRRAQARHGLPNIMRCMYQSYLKYLMANRREV